MGRWHGTFSTSRAKRLERCSGEHFRDGTALCMYAVYSAAAVYSGVTG